MFVVKTPGINGLGKTKGCEKAGNAIIDALKDIHSSESGNPIDARLLDLEEIHLDNSNVEEANKLIYKNSFEAFETKPRTIFLGGDHSISFSTTRAFLEYCRQNEKEPCLIVLDAHADCMTPMEEPTHEEWLRALIEKGFPTENILLVGARNLWRDEIVFLNEKRIKNISLNYFLENIGDICDTITEFASGKELYVSIDIDVLDASIIKGTGYPELAGLTMRQLIYLIQRLNKMRNLRAIDIVEINPDKDPIGDQATVKIGAKILSELI